LMGLRVKLFTPETISVSQKLNIISIHSSSKALQAAGFFLGYYT